LSNDEQSTAQAWLSQRLRPGNWLDIDPGEEIPPEITDWTRTLVHMHQICFSPEIRRRKDAGKLVDDFLLWGAQLIQPHEGGRVIRINEEVRGVPYLRTGRAVEKDEQILLSDLNGLEYFDLEDEELDCGHFTIFWTGSVWVGAFDFRAGRAKCLSLIEKSLTFLAATKLSVRKGLAEPAIDTLHTACELLAKARLILSHIPAHKWRSHGSISSAINREGRLGNVDAAFLTLFNRLSDTRSHAKYATGYAAELLSHDDLDVVESMAVGLQQAARKKQPKEMAGER
jgi:hypothetical protein